MLPLYALKVRRAHQPEPSALNFPDHRASGGGRPTRLDAESVYASRVTHSSLDPGQLHGMAGHIAYEVEMLALTGHELLSRGLGDLSVAASPSDAERLNVRGLIDRRVAHLTLDRLVFLVGIQPAIIARRLLARYHEFVGTLPALKWPALDRAATAASECLDHLKSLELPGFVVSSTTQSVVTVSTDFSPYFAAGHSSGPGAAP